MEKLKYPIGTFEAPALIHESQRDMWIAQIAALPQQLRETIQPLNREELDTPYRPGGWTVKQVVHHLADSHCNAYIRFHLALTEENPVIKPYKEAVWASLPYLQSLDPEISLRLLSAVHERWSALLRAINEDDFKKTYTHPEYQRVYTLAIATGSYAWHGLHHLAHIQQLVLRNFDRD